MLDGIKNTFVSGLHQRRVTFICGALMFAACALLPSTVNTAAASLDMLEDEIVTYVDVNGMYTVAGNVKNTYLWAAVPILHLQIQDGSTFHKVTVPYNAIPAGGELPFKIKIPSASANASLHGYELSSVAAASSASAIKYKTVTLDVLYDHTLIVHEDGHLSGFAINSGSDALHDPVVWAVAHGANDVLDVVYSKALGVVEPGQTVSFELYPDDSVADAVVYYSCFAPSDRSVHPLNAQRGDQKYGMRYESGAWLYRPVFAENGTDVVLQTTNSYPFETFANIEIPPVTQKEKFEVFRNGELINSTQSKGDTGSWHVAFEIQSRSQDVITIRGFEQGEILPIIVPEYIKQDMQAWALGQADDQSMMEIMLWLADRSKLPYGMPGQQSIPSWVGTLVIWWNDQTIDEDAFMSSLSYMIKTGLIRLG